MDQTAGDFLLQVLIDGALLRFFFCSVLKLIRGRVRINIIPVQFL